MIEIDKALMAAAQSASGQMKKHKCETLALSDPDREAFFEALINPPKPSERLVRALAAHEQRVAS